MIKPFIFMILMAIVYSLLEIQVEGKRGWCETLPTFRINVFFRKLLGGKPLTGYHLYLLIFMIIVFHGLFCGEKYTWKISANALGLMSYFFVLEDIMWFIFNPHFTLKKFKPRYIRWHKRWIWKLPLTYYWGIIIGTILLLLGSK